MQSILDSLSWSNPSEHPRDGGKLLLKVATATPEFWNSYRGHEREWFDVGVSVQKRGSVWIVKWWSDANGVFDATKRAKPPRQSKAAAIHSKKKP